MSDLTDTLIGYADNLDEGWIWTYESHLSDKGVELPVEPSGEDLPEVCRMAAERIKELETKLSEWEDSASVESMIAQKAAERIKELEQTVKELEQELSYRDAKKWVSEHI